MRGVRAAGIILDLVSRAVQFAFARDVKSDPPNEESVQGMIIAATRFSVYAALFAVLAAIPTHAQDVPPDDWRTVATDRLKAIYDRREFRVPDIDAEWLDDSSAYRIQEQNQETSETVTAQYDVGSGERQIVQPDAKPSPRNSPNGKFTFEVRDNQLFLNEQGGEETQLVATTEGRDVDFRNFRWSHSGKAASFVKVDRTNVRFRTMLVPSDPSYPGVTERRFARVGGTLEHRQVGVVDVDRKQVRWVSIDASEEGFYLGQVDWVPKSDELLIETLSRFRDKREFWLATTDGKAKRIYREVNEAWAVGSHGINSGAHWIRDGEAFIFISEKEGWRQAYVCSRDGKVESKLTPGEYDIINRVFVDEANGWYYFYASPENGTQKYLHRVALDLSLIHI